MEHEQLPDSASPRASSLLDRFTAMILLAVVLALGWIIIRAYEPDYLRVFSEETEVVLMVLILGTALGLVSVVALSHTRH